MKFIINESQFDRIILDEGLKTFLTKIIPKSFQQAKQSLPTFMSKGTVKTLTDNLNKILPKQYLKNPKEVSGFIRKLNDLGPNINQINTNYIKKYGLKEYNSLMQRYLYGDITKKEVLSKLNSVKNVNIKIKPYFGKGADHVTYTSLTHPDKLFKVELRPGEINKWYNTFTSRTDVFPKVFKKIKVKAPDGKLLDGAVMEKLNIHEFMKLWDDMEKMLFYSQKNIPPTQKVSQLETLVKRIKTGPKYENTWENFVNYTKTNSGSLSKKTDEFVKMVDKLYGITSNPDIRKFNFGYNKDGILKCLDI